VKLGPAGAELAHGNPRRTAGNAVAAEAGWPVLATFDDSVSQWAAHPGIKAVRKGGWGNPRQTIVADCRHWCLPSEPLAARVRTLLQLLARTKASQGWRAIHEPLSPRSNGTDVATPSSLAERLSSLSHAQLLELAQKVAAAGGTAVASEPAASRLVSPRQVNYTRHVSLLFSVPEWKLRGERPPRRLPGG